MSNVFNLDAPIVPGKSAAGISIDDSIEDILLQAKPFTITDLSQEKRYQFGSVSLWVNDKGKIKQIGLHPGYRGKIAESIGIGSTISEIIGSLGVVVEDEEDNLVVEGSPGWCFDSSQWRLLPSGVPDTSATVTEIYIFHLDNQRRGIPRIPTTCLQCANEMQFDLILKDRRGANSLHVSPVLTNDILGYGFYCHHCRRGWTGHELLGMANDKGASPP